TIKYNPAGIQQWIQTYDGPANGADHASFIKIDGSNNLYVSGVSTGIGTAYDYTTVKYNSSGVQQWVARYTSQGYIFDVVNSMTVDVSGNVFVTCYSLGDFVTIKYNTLGVQQWLKAFNGSGNGADYGNAIGVDASGN